MVVLIVQGRYLLRVDRTTLRISGPLTSRCRSGLAVFSSIMRSSSFSGTDPGDDRRALRGSMTNLSVPVTLTLRNAADEGFVLGLHAYDLFGSEDMGLDDVRQPLFCCPEFL